MFKAQRSHGFVDQDQDIQIKDGRALRRWIQALLSGIQWQDKRQWAETEIQKNQTKPNLYFLFFSLWGYWTPEHVAQGGGAVSILGDIKKPKGQSPELSLTLLWAGGFGLGSLSRHQMCPSKSAILWFQNNSGLTRSLNELSGQSNSLLVQ